MGSVLIELHDDWQAAERRNLAEGSMALLDQPGDDECTREVDLARTLLLAS